MTVEDVVIDVVRKQMKTWRLSVYPPDGRVRLAAPLHLDDNDLHRTIFDRLAWIRSHQERLRARAYPAPRQYTSGEECLYLGQSMRLEVTHHAGNARVRLCDDVVVEMLVRPESTVAQRERALVAWYRRQMEEVIPPIIARWEPILGVKVNTWHIKAMRTRWGTCNPAAGRIWVNLHLIKRPLHCIEYLVVHELVHLLERGHNARFWGLMDQHLPDWRARRAELNVTPIDTL